jgi:hypothetical protein
MKSTGYSRSVDLQTLKQAATCLARAMELFVQKDDADAVAQVELAWRFLDEFVDRRG